MTAPVTSTKSAPRLRPRTAPPAASQSGNFSLWAAINEFLTSVEWTPSLIAFMYYYFVVITYYLPGADYAMVAALAGLVFQLPQLRFGKALTLMAAFVAWAWVSYAASPNRTLAFDQTWTLTKLWLVVFVAYNVLQSRAQIRMFMAFAVACFVLFPVRGATVNFLVGENVMGRASWNYTYNNPNDLAAFALMFASIAVALSLVARSRLVRWAGIVSVSMMVVLIFFTQSRGGLLSLGVVTFFTMIRRLRNPKVALRVLLVLGLAAYLAPDGVWVRLGGLSKVSVEGGMKGVDREGSAEQRYQLLGVAMRIASEHPITGVGAGTYSTFHQQYARDNRAEFPLAGGKKDAHNTYVHTAAELGSVGLLIFLTCCVAMIVFGHRASRQMRPSDSAVVRILTLGLVAYLLAGIFASLEYINVLYLHLALLESAALAFGATSARPRTVPVSLGRTNRPNFAY